MSRELVLVTGGSGFVGQATLQALMARGRRVLATTTRLRAQPGPAGDLSWVEWDAPAQPLPAVDWTGIGSICHLAVPRLTPHEEASDRLFALNVAATYALLEAARRHGVPRVVIASTGDVLAPEHEVASEDDITYRPRTFYGYTKSCAELLARAYERFVSVAIARIFHPWGPGGDRFVVNRLIRKVLAGEPIPLEAPRGILLNPIWIDDLGQGLALAADCRATGILHFAGPEQVRLADLLESVGRAVGRPAHLQFRPGPPEPYHAASVASTTALLDWQPSVGIHEGLTRFLAQPAS